MKQPDSSLLATLTDRAGMMISPTASQKLGADLSNNATGAGTGPFQFAEWVPDDHVLLKRNQSYWNTSGGPYFDELRIIDAVLSFPAPVLALALGAVLGAVVGVLIALGIVYTPTFAGLMRGQVLSVRTRDYVQAARVLGGADWWILLRHILPNTVTPIVVQASLSIGFAILAEASLSFLGLGMDCLRPWRGALHHRTRFELCRRRRARRARSEFAGAATTHARGDRDPWHGCAGCIQSFGRAVYALINRE